MPIWGQAEKRYFGQAWLGDVQQVFGNAVDQHEVPNLSHTWRHRAGSAVPAVWPGSGKIFQLIWSRLNDADLADAWVLPSYKLCHTSQGAKSGKAYNVSVLGFVPLYFKLWQICLSSASSFWGWTINILVIPASPRSGKHQKKPLMRAFLEKQG